jgi:hypothetical protein
MIAAGGHFYTSGTFWAGAGVAVAIVFGIAGVWAVLYSGNPKRRLLYSMPVVTPLLNDRPRMPRDVEVRHAGQLLQSPHVVNIELVSRGRSDIQREAFDGGEPLCLDVGVPIVECLQVTTSPSDRPEPLWKHDGSKLLVGPSLIGKRQSTVFSLLVDGPSPKLSRPPRSLIDVDLRPGDLGPESRIKRRRYVLAVAFALTVTAEVALTPLGPIWSHTIPLLAFVVCVPYILYARRFDR